MWRKSLRALLGIPSSTVATSKYVWVSCPFEGESNMHKHWVRPTKESGRHDLDEPIRARDRNYIPATMTIWGLAVLVFGCYFGVLLLVTH
jgi:hypothetical protein